MASGNDGRRIYDGGGVNPKTLFNRPGFPIDRGGASPKRQLIDPDGVMPPKPIGRPYDQGGMLPPKPMPYDNGGVNPKTLFNRPGQPIDPGGIVPPKRAPYDDGGVNPKQRPWWVAMNNNRY